MDKPKAWFETWFDSPYYHVLYDHRDEAEARLFIDNLKERLHLGTENVVLDLACGAGRHAAWLSEFTGHVVGLDLSANSIAEATRRYARPNLEFYVHDMRLPFRINYFDHIFNLFTSFGYFKSEADNLRVLRAANSGLKPGGKLLIDFMNADKAVRELVPRETVEKRGIPFYIRRECTEGIINKYIKFEDQGKVFQFTESVQALRREDFLNMAGETGFEPLEEFGNYSLGPFQVTDSPRYILLLQKV